VAALFELKSCGLTEDTLRGFRIYIIVDIVGQYVQNGIGGRPLCGGTGYYGEGRRRGGDERLDA